MNKLMTNDDNVIQIAIIKILAPNKASLFSLNIFGILMNKYNPYNKMKFYIKRSFFKKTLNLKPISKEKKY